MRAFGVIWLRVERPSNGPNIRDGSRSWYEVQRWIKRIHMILSNLLRKGKGACIEHRNRASSHQHALEQHPVPSELRNCRQYSLSSVDGKECADTDAN